MADQVNKCPDCRLERRNDEVLQNEPPYHSTTLAADNDHCGWSSRLLM